MMKVWNFVENHKTTLVTCFKFAAYIFFITVILPAHFAAVIASLIMRAIVGRILAPWYIPGLSGFYTDAGITMTNDQPHIRPYVGHVWYLVCNGTVSVEDLREKFKTQVFSRSKNNSNPDKYVRMRQFWTPFCGYLFWRKDADFKIENHIRMYDYTCDKNLALPLTFTAEKDLRRLMGPLMAKGYQKDRSPWELLIIPNYKTQITENINDPKQSCVIILRMHHALADIISIFKLLQRLFDQEHIRTPQPKFQGNLTLGQKIGRNLAIATLGPYGLVSTMVDAILAGRNCWHDPAKKLPQDYYTLFSDKISMSRLKDIMLKYQVNSNAVFNTVITGAICKLMLEAGQEVADSFSFIYPFTLPNHPGGTVNHVTLDFFTLKSHVSGCPVQRLREISRTVKAADHLLPLPNFYIWLHSTVTLLPLKLVYLLTRSLVFTAVMSNGTGLQEELHVIGKAKLVDIIPGLGLAHASCGCVAVMVSLAGNARMVLNVDRNVFNGFQKPKNFAKYVDEELELLRQA